MNRVVPNVWCVILDDSGQGLVEYAMIISLVALVCVAALTFFGKKASNSLSNSANMIPN